MKTDETQRGVWPETGLPAAAPGHGPRRMWEEIRAVADALPVLFTYVGADQRYRYANRAYEEWFGAEGPLDGKHIREGLDEDVYEALRPRVEAALAGRPVVFEVSARHRDGEWRYAQVAYVPRFGDGGEVRGFFAVIVDITERRRAEEALRLITEGTAGTTGEGFFQSLVRHLASALNVRVAFVGEIADPATTRARVLALWMDGKLQEPFEYVLAGTPCENVVGRTLCSYPDRVQELFPDDRWLAEVGARSYLGIPFFDAAGKAIGHMGVLDDRPMGDDARPTSILRIFAARAGAELERIRTEQALREREEQLRQSHKMEAIGRFATGIAHDFNNMLGAIRGFAELAMPGIPEGSLAHENLQEVLRAADRAQAFGQEILLFGRPGEEEREVLQLHTVVDEVLGLVRASLPPTVQIRKRTRTQTDDICADANQMRRVVINLCANAGHAMRDRGGVLEVTIDAVEGEPSYRTTVGTLEDRPYVRLTVTDTGDGIPPEILPHVFEPFFTTKARSDGSGLGLALVERIVTGHGGAIALRSEPGRGTTFEILLPWLRAATAPSVTEDVPAPCGSGRLLLVDDDEQFIQMCTRQLESLGYEVVPCRAGGEALQTFAAAPHGFVAVVTDQTMPGMTGAVLATRLLGIRPDLPIVLYSAYGDTLTREVARALGVREYLTKPSSRHDLAAALSRAMKPE